jgi:hypothetical protein
MKLFDFIKMHKTLFIIAGIIITAILLGLIFHQSVGIFFGVIGTAWTAIAGKKPDDSDVEKHNTEISMIDKKIDELDKEIETSCNRLTQLKGEETAIREAMGEISETMKKEVDRMSLEELVSWANKNM